MSRLYLIHSKGPWKDHKYLKVENGQYIYNNPSNKASASVKAASSKSIANKNEEYNRSFTNTAIYKTGKTDGPLKGVPYKQTAGGFYLYDNPTIRNGKGKYLVIKPDGSRVYINDVSKFKSIRETPLESTSDSKSNGSGAKKKNVTTKEQIEELKDQITEIDDLEADISNDIYTDALAAREMEQLEAERKAKEEAIKKKRQQEAFNKSKKNMSDRLKKKRKFEGGNKVTNRLEHNDARTYAIIMHSAKGATWKDHKYIRKEGNRYIYKEDVDDTKKGKNVYVANIKPGERIYSPYSGESKFKGTEIEKIRNRNAGNDIKIAKDIAKITTGSKVGDTSRSLKNNPAGYAYDYSNDYPVNDNGRNIGRFDIAGRSPFPSYIDPNDYRLLKTGGFKYMQTEADITRDLFKKWGVTDKDFIDNIDGIDYYKDPKNKGMYLSVDKSGKFHRVTKLPKKPLKEKIGITQKENLEVAKGMRKGAVDELREYTKGHGVSNTYLTGRAQELNEAVKKAQDSYDSTPLAKAEKKVNEVKSDVKNAGKKATSTVKNTGKKVGSTLKDLEGKIVKETTTVTDTNGKVLGTYTKPSSFKDVGSVMKKNISSEIKETGSKLKSGLSNIVTRTSDDHELDSVKVIKKKLKHSDLGHSYRIIRS